MDNWPKHPIIYEINTWVWLNELSGKYGRPVTLGSIPEEEWNDLASCGFDAVWFMGVWERSPAGIAIANRNVGLCADFRRALPDFAEADNVGSPYCIRRYVVDEHLGGPDGLAVARKALAHRRIRLILDFVANHVAPDHPWVSESPEYFIAGSPGDLSDHPESYLECGGRVFACGRDPYFPPWPDVLQLNGFSEGLRRVSAQTLVSIAGQCDGVRCDMAMLLVNNIFRGTWGDRVGPGPVTEYWSEIIAAVRAESGDFRFIAEAYWDLEWELQQQGFDYCYDKRLYDRLKNDCAEMTRLHLLADLTYQEKLVRFIENHDEPRAADAFFPDKHRAILVAAMTLPGAKLLHEGQLQGRKVKLPVFLGRRPVEAPNQDLGGFYNKLLQAIQSPSQKEGDWRLCERTGWPDNTGFLNLVAWSWSKSEERMLIVVNLSNRPSQALVHLPWDNAPDRGWLLVDVLAGVEYSRSGNEAAGGMLYVDLPPWAFHFFEVLT